MALTLNWSVLGPSGDWQRSSGLVAEEASSESKRPGFTIAHYNILFADNLATRLATRSAPRFRHFPRGILHPLLDAKGVEVISFNESCKLFEETAVLPGMIAWRDSKQQGAAAPRVHFISAKQGGGRHHCAFLSTLPVLQVCGLELQPPTRPALVMLVSKRMPGTGKTEDFVFCTTHLRHSETLQSAGVRREQLGDLVQYLHRIASGDHSVGTWMPQDSALSARMQAALEQRRLCIVGDFNYHYPGETEDIYRRDFFDCWRALHGPSERAEEAGKTWCEAPWYLPFDNRRMRLDRMILRQECNGFRPSHIEVFGANRVPGHSFTFSDHYGILMELSSTSSTVGRAQEDLVPCSPGRTSLRPVPFVPSRKEEESPWETGYRTMDEIIKIRILAFLVLPLIALLGFFFFIFFIF